MKNILVTGGLGFIGLNLIEILLEESNNYGIENILVIDKDGYASDYHRLGTIYGSHIKNSKNPVDLKFIKLDLSENDKLVHSLIAYEVNDCRIDTVFHLAAESHVDNSINSPRPFIESNILGTFNLIEYFRTTMSNRPEGFRFHHVSTDEVYGQLRLDLPFSQFNIGDPYNPSSPYSASKAASDHLVQSYIKTFGFPATISNCGNNYGRYQHKEKLIPHVIECLVKGEKFPVYGAGNNVRDWIHVRDHCKALIKIITDGKIGNTYLIGACNEMHNLGIIAILCELFNEVTGKKVSSDEFVKFVEDRKAHDTRYSINNESMIELGWSPEVEFTDGLLDTVKFYLKEYKYDN